MCVTDEGLEEPCEKYCPITQSFHRLQSLLQRNPHHQVQVVCSTHSSELLQGPLCQYLQLHFPSNGLHQDQMVCNIQKLQNSFRKHHPLPLCFRHHYHPHKHHLG